MYYNTVTPWVLHFLGPKKLLTISTLIEVPRKPLLFEPPDVNVIYYLSFLIRLFEYITKRVTYTLLSFCGEGKLRLKKVSLLAGVGQPKGMVCSLLRPWDWCRVAGSSSRAPAACVAHPPVGGLQRQFQAMNGI